MRKILYLPLAQASAAFWASSDVSNSMKAVPFGLLVAEFITILEDSSKQI